MRLLAISGSLRAVSTNTTLLNAAMRLAPDGMTIALFEGLATLPPFNPDLDVDPLPAAVADWRGRVAAADGLLISSPEYARGIPGSLKNAFDWMVSDTEFAGKPVAFFHASERAVASQAALRLVLETMSARIVEDATITVPLLGKQTDVDSLLHDKAVTGRIVVALEAYAVALT
ncbi:MAG: NAD(P)H-dependent oxidoreductase [Proteobacteria bacterium]|nr:NAD(P)H-dependent oxidoreductase [Pseudomonadota bacterium]